MSMVENLKEIQAKGVHAFLRNQETKYACPNCGDVVSSNRMLFLTKGCIDVLQISSLGL
jgi:hypothetical protein